MIQNAVGIFGGSFNPVHLGHVQLAKQIQERCGFNPLYIVPTKSPPHKPAYEVEEKHRIEMVRLAFEDVANTQLSMFEIESEGPSYAIRTIEYFTRRHQGSPIYFILGADAFHDLPKWYAFPDVMEACSYVVVQRAGWEPEPSAEIDEDDFDDQASKLGGRLNKLVSAGLLRPVGPAELATTPFDEAFATRSGTRVGILNVKLPEISSTEVRLRLQLGENINNLVPDAVARYLKTSGLYGTQKS